MSRRLLRRIRAEPVSNAARHSPRGGAFSRAMVVVIGAVRVRPGLHVSAVGALVALAVVLVVALAARCLRALSNHHRREHARLKTIDVDVPHRAILLVNARAGAIAGLGRARAAMTAAGIEVVEEASLQDRNRLERRLRGPSSMPLLLVAAGGDGTVSAAVDLLVGTDAVLGVLPLGTSNDVARSLGLPLDPAAAAGVLASGAVCAIDAGRLITPGQPARHFVHAATAGVNVAFARHATDAALRERFGRLSYAVAAVAALRHYEPFDCDLRPDEAPAEHLRLVHLAVLNTPVYGGFLDLRLESARVDDRMLHVVAVEQLPVRRLLGAALRTAVGLKRPIRGVHAWHVRSLDVHTGRSVQVALDGEVLGALPGRFEVVAEAVRVVIPARG